MTAHAAQGQTLPAAIVDFEIVPGTNAIASYVALTRVPSREDLLIYRQFARDLYTQGGPEGPELLLKTLRGEQVDWAATEAKHTASRVCSGCGFMHFKDDFALSQWNRKDGRHLCKQCVAHKTNAGVPLECVEGCGLWKSAAALSHEDLRKTLHRVCVDSVEWRHCKACGETKLKAEFTSSEWTIALSTQFFSFPKDRTLTHGGVR